MAICCVSEKSQTAYVRKYTARPGFFRFLASLFFERPANFEFFNSQLSFF